MSRTSPPVTDRGAYRHYVLGVLTSVYMLNLVDRSLIMLLLQPIKEDLRLSDTQLGFITGIAFSLFYATLGLPIARIADRGNRVKITALAIGLWGLTVMACIAVANYTQLVLARIAAAVGEAGCKPPTYSLVGDYFPGATERSRALAVYFSGAAISALISFIVGGWINAHYGWRAAFFVMGIPGLLLAILVKLTVREPRAQLPAQTAATPMPRFADILTLLWRRRSSRHLSIALILLYMLGAGLSPWYAAFLIRSHGLRTDELGLWLGLIFGIGGMTGALAGGFLLSRLFPDNFRRQMQLSAVMVILIIPCYFAFLLVPARHWAIAALAPLVFVYNGFLGPVYAVMQRLVAERMRATALAVVMLLANLIGSGLGPQFVGIGSDLLAPAFGAESLRIAMLAMSFIAIWAAWHFWAAARTIEADLKLAAAESPIAGATSDGLDNQ